MIIQSDPDWENGAIQLFVLEEQHVTKEYVNWLNDPEINRFLESRFVPHDIESTMSFVRDMVTSENALFLGIHSKPLNRHVGNIKLAPIDRKHGLGEIGLMIGDRDAWGMGIASQSIALITNIGFSALGLRKITAGCYATNIGSKRAFEKAGFHIEGVRKHHFILTDKPEDLVLLACFADS